jgi:hypothetical protein
VGEPDLVVPRMLSALPAADQETVLDPIRPILALPAAQRSAYVRTLDALHRHGGTHAGAAAVLHVHPNTVRYRTDRIEEMTGMRLADPHDRMRLDLAATLVILGGWPPDLHTDLAACFRMRERPRERSDELAGVLAGVDREVGAEGDHLVAGAQGDDLGERRRADQRLGGEGVERQCGVDGQALAVPAAGLDQAGRGAVASAGVARLEGVVSLTTDLADLDGAEEAVSSHALPGFPSTA